MPRLFVLYKKKKKVDDRLSAVTTMPSFYFKNSGPKKSFFNYFDSKIPIKHHKDLNLKITYLKLNTFSKH